MFDTEVCSYLADEDRQEIAEEYYAKGKTEMAKALKGLDVSPETIALASGLTLEEIDKL